MAKTVTGASSPIVKALVDAKIIADPNMVSRVLIDIRAGCLPIVYVQTFADESGVAGVIAEIASDFEPGQVVT